MKRRRKIPPKTQHIIVSDTTKSQLEEIGNMRDTYDDVVQKLINYWNENH